MASEDAPDEVKSRYPGPELIQNAVLDLAIQRLAPRDIGLTGGGRDQTGVLRVVQPGEVLTDIGIPELVRDQRRRGVREVGWSDVRITVFVSGVSMLVNHLL